MNIPVFLGMVMARANAVPGAGDPPSAAPSDVTVTLYAGTKRLVSWTKGDVTAESRVYYKVGGTYTYITQVAAGVEESETGDSTHTVFGVSHYKNGQESAKADGSLGA